METTLGIDLASQPANTGLCVIEWHAGRGRVQALVRGSWDGTPLHDDLLIGCITGTGSGGWGESRVPVMTAIDAPFGWPDPFVDALVRHRDGGPWPSRIGEPRARFVRRRTDEVVGAHQHTKLPLAVSADRIAYPAMRCAVLLGELLAHLPEDQLARDGSGRVCEAYPDAALRCWLPDAWVGPKPDSYKGDGAAAVARRALLLDALLDGLDRTTFTISDAQREACVACDDVLDALVCALLARAAQLGLTEAPQPGDETGRARREGWIHLPVEGSLARLADAHG